MSTGKWLFQDDRQIGVRAIPREGISLADRLQRYRRGLLERSIGSVLPTAAAFHERLKGRADLPEVRRLFVGSSLAVERAIRICEVGGLMSAVTAKSARDMFAELRSESFRAIDRLEEGVRDGVGMSVHSADAFFRDAQAKIQFLRKLAEQTLKIKRPELAEQLLSAPAPAGSIPSL